MRLYWRIIGAVNVMTCLILIATGSLLFVVPLIGALVVGASVLIDWATRGTVPRSSVTEDDYVEAREAGVLRACERFVWAEDDPNHPLSKERAAEARRRTLSLPKAQLQFSNDGYLVVWERGGKQRKIDPRRVSRYDLDDRTICIHYTNGGSMDYYWHESDAALGAPGWGAMP